MPNLSNTSTIRLTHNIIVKSPGLLPMMYTVREISEELEMPERTLRDWLKHGAPHSRDRLNHIWINGREFADWIKSCREKKIHTRMQDNQAYCFCCKERVNPSKLTSQKMVGKLILLRGHCPICGTQVNRGGRLD